MRGPTLCAGLAAMLALTACSPRGAEDADRQQNAEIENQTVEFEALDRLLGATAREAGGGVPPSGWVIAQLLGQTS